MKSAKMMTLLASTAILLSLGLAGTAGATVFGPGYTQLNNTVGNTISVNLQVPIPTQYETINFTANTPFVQQVYCGWYLINQPNLSATMGNSVIATGGPALVYGTLYNETFNYTFPAPGIYEFGASCKYSNDTYDYGTSSWSGWSNATTVSSTTQDAWHVTYGPIMAPPPLNPLSIVESFFQDIENLVKTFFMQ